jgi:hypothetical protein
MRDEKRSVNNHLKDILCRGEECEDERSESETINYRGVGSFVAG